ncbi:hypothetical protein A6A03_05105 [Chloroflexus islandicus]|uniref:Uncharacterized protein n=1 Tax=Chloroflexus islandicus TaxID=1707952 RepID=A0A178LW23_9CHLR|nr:hypothetical protein [Chloroflexus islandicus]OAN38269.1 hypothetical protein A6A03_05105 [Chloroflexus islandicus]
MNDPLANLLARSFGELAGAVQPRLPARFELVAPFGGEVAVPPVQMGDQAAPGSPPVQVGDQVTLGSPPVQVGDQAAPGSPPVWVEPSPAPLASAIPPVERRQIPPLPVAPLAAWGQPPTTASELRRPSTMPPAAPERISPDRGVSEANSERTAPASLAGFVEPRGLPAPANAIDPPRLADVAAVSPASAVSFQPASVPDAPREPGVPAIRPFSAPAPVMPREPVAPPPREPAAPPHPPRITVTIGRVEVRAVPPPPPSSRPRPQPPAPRLSLDEYLRRREGGTR